MLAGGGSTRFGRDKLKELYRGAPLLDHVVRRIAEVCPEVVVVVAHDAPDPELPPGITVRVARDLVEGEGPLAGLLAGLAETRTGLALMAGGDMPELSTAVLREMLRIAAEAGADAVALQEGDRFRPLPAVVRTALAGGEARTLLESGERRLRALLNALRVAVIDEPTWSALDPERRTLRDIDVPGDLSD